MVEERLAGTDGWPGNRYTLQQLQDTVFDNRQYAGELWRDELADFCETTPTMVGTGGPVDVSEACPVLRAWDLHDDLDSQRRDPVPALREPGAGRRAGRRHARALHDPVRRRTTPSTPRAG